MSMLVFQRAVEHDCCPALPADLTEKAELDGAWEIAGRIAERLRALRLRPCTIHEGALC